MSTNMIQTIKAASDKFGYVESIKQTDTDGKEFSLLIDRVVTKTFIKNGRTFMTIRAYKDETNSICFIHGHYDLSHDDAILSYNSRNGSQDRNKA